MARFQCGRSKHEVMYPRPPEKALVISRRLVQSAKQRSRVVFIPETFAKPDAKVTERQRDRVYIGRLNPKDNPGPEITLPATIEKPTLPSINKELIGYFEPELKNIPVDYVCDALVSMGTRLMGVFKKCRADPPRVALPDEIDILVTDAGLACLPTHVLAVHGPVDRATFPSRVSMLFWQGREITILPVHAVILAAHCGRLPHMPPSRPRPPPILVPGVDGQIANAYKLPMVPFMVPQPQCLEQLVRYMYTHDVDALLLALVPMRAPVVLSGDRNALYAARPAFDKGIGKRQRIFHVAQETIGYHNGQMRTILRQAKWVEGFYLNAGALAVGNDALWETMDIAWEGIVMALRMMKDINEQVAAYDAAQESARLSADAGPWVPQ